MKLRVFKVYLGRKEIDRVFYDANCKETSETVKKSLIEHDGYNPNIKVIEERN